MKIGICNLTGSAIKKGVNSNSNEIINIGNQLSAKDSIYCEIVNNCEGEGEFNSIFVDLANPAEYDAMLIMNSHANFFGGVRNDGVLRTYQFLAKLKCPIFYLFNDTNLIFAQLYEQIKNRTWNDLSELDVKITAPFYVVSQFTNLDDFIISKTSKQIDIEEIKNIDFGTWLLDDYKNKLVENSAEYDLIYGGSFRSGKRESKFIDLFYNRTINTAIYGSDRKSVV